MGLLHDEVIFLNFDQSYVPQKKLLQIPHYWIDLDDIKHTNYYCEETACTKIEERLYENPHQGITFIGSGNYHYVSYLLFSEIKEPFTLILFDHHTDAMIDSSSVSSLISCGSWVAHAISQLSFLQKVLIIGARKDLLPLIHPSLRSKVVVLPENDSRLSSKFVLHWLQNEIATDTIYISIDKDVLDTDYVKTNWDQGNMSLPELLIVLREIIRQKEVYGVDICGEYPTNPFSAFQSISIEAIRKNEQANQKILNTILNPKSP
ncbi:arginase family protein [Tepidibacillus fermentans]|uniref:Arginase family protein n=1 Tax=Tepidibacillus fermentans TaxID=1281767 RepID=A0A4R3KII4_9BACI|nr:arginase family protein [Tepidibacillus fermentans]TCS83179.1 arginase family protein [Tepidibacillus fermentans]